MALGPAAKRRPQGDGDRRDGREHYYRLTQKGIDAVKSIREARQRMYEPLNRLLGSNSKKEEFCKIISAFTDELDRLDNGRRHDITV